ncbi:IS66 family insertion sequence element accessory protein TnpB [Paracoccus hibiscisoli]|uniref:IS66 family insertion sequence element accessory protein TnpB n=1 Tax=Paracoccus hibiscisoli TaxID=2023261 RepID=A0A4U0QA38_9RHOB|nr:IS66 family insertion sequence element accessory protein TnpB [Paracoccus hibiscisoli]TJZ78199.1 IS66 family insertion sequence element accessory protein TnpB [Paracoccus hibiscisoli]
MMLGQGGPTKVYMVTRPVDFRKGSEEGQKTVRWTVFPTTGLALAVQEMFGLDPFCGAVFVFRSKRADRIKLLVWDQTGMVLVHKRLEGGKLVWPQMRDGVMRISSAQLAALSKGWIGGWCGRNGRGVRWSQGERADAREFPVFASQNRVSVIHSEVWMPMPSAVRTLI